VWALSRVGVCSRATYHKSAGACEEPRVGCEAIYAPEDELQIVLAAKRGKTTQTEAKAGRGQSPRRPRLPKPREGEAGQLVRSDVRRACCRVFEKAGVESRIHDLRAHATQMLKAGVLPGGRAGTLTCSARHRGWSRKRLGLRFGAPEGKRGCAWPARWMRLACRRRWLRQ